MQNLEQFQADIKALRTLNGLMLEEITTENITKIAQHSKECLEAIKRMENNRENFETFLGLFIGLDCSDKLAQKIDAVCDNLCVPSDDTRGFDYEAAYCYDRYEPTTGYFQLIENDWHIPVAEASNFDMAVAVQITLEVFPKHSKEFIYI